MSTIHRSPSLYAPDVKDNALEALREGGGTKEERVVEPGIFAVAGCLELWCATEIERGIAFFVLATGYDASVADVDIDTVIGLDAIDSLELGATGAVGYLIVGTAIDDGSLDIRPFESTARNGNNSTSAVLRLTTGIGLAECDLQLHDELQLWSVFGNFNLCAGVECECQQR